MPILVSVLVCAQFTRQLHVTDCHLGYARLAPPAAAKAGHLVLLPLGLSRVLHVAHAVQRLVAPEKKWLIARFAEFL